MSTGKKNDGFAKTIERIRAQRRAARRLDRTSVLVGWIDGSRTLNNRTPFAVIARTLCYGREEGVTRNGWRYPAIPPRDFMKAYFREEQKPVFRAASNCLSLIFSEGSEYQADLARQLAPIGATAEGGLRKAIVRQHYKPNARSTVLAWARRHAGTKKGLTSTDKKELVDTGAMVQHITYSVEGRR